MTAFAIGDIQGCYKELRSLLKKINYSNGKDSLWIAGDLINRGPNNVETLQFLMDQDNIQVVLGNHDLHFMGIARGLSNQHRGDTLSDLLEHPELDSFVAWLRQQPIVNYNADYNTLLVHAGVPGMWDRSEVLAFSEEVHDQLRTDNFNGFLKEMYGNRPSVWDANITGFPRLRLITNFLTRMRFYRHPGQIELTHKQSQAPEGFKPWFHYRHPSMRKTTILFGHWAALQGIQQPYLAGLDTGCVYGRHLTAVRVDDGQLFRQQALP